MYFSCLRYLLLSVTYYFNMTSDFTFVRDSLPFLSRFFYLNWLLFSFISNGSVALLPNGNVNGEINLYHTRNIRYPLSKYLVRLSDEVYKIFLFFFRRVALSRLLLFIDMSLLIEVSFRTLCLRSCVKSSSLFYFLVTGASRFCFDFWKLFLFWLFDKLLEGFCKASL